MIIKLKYHSKGTTGFYLTPSGDILPATIYSTVAQVVDEEVSIKFNIDSDGYKWIDKSEFFYLEERAIKEKAKRIEEAEKKERKRLREEKMALKNKIQEIDRLLKNNE